MIQSATSTGPCMNTTSPNKRLHYDFKPNAKTIAAIRKAGNNEQEQTTIGIQITSSTRDVKWALKITKRVMVNTRETNSEKMEG